MPAALRLPDLTLPFPGEFHPGADEWERDANDWLATHLDDPSALRQLARTRAGRVVARTADPEASADLLRWYARFVIWGFWFDDLLIDDHPADSPILVPAVASVLDILDTGVGTGAAGAALEEAFAAVVRSLREILHPDQFTRWSIEMRLWFTSMIAQNKLRAQGSVPSVKTYKTIRRYTVCAFPCIVLIDASHEKSVDWDQYHDPDLAALRTHAANVTAWQNDIFSFFSESYHPGRFWNLPSIYVARGTSAQEALDRTARDAAREVDAFTARAASVETTDARRRSHLRTLTSWMRGCHDWSHEAAARYVGWWGDDQPGSAGHPAGTGGVGAG